MTTPELIVLIPRFRLYCRTHADWGSLYLVFKMRKMQDECVQHCLDYAVQEGDEEGAALAGLLMEMKVRQRLRMAQCIGKPSGRWIGPRTPSRRLDAVVRGCAK